MNKTDAAGLVAQLRERGNSLNRTVGLGGLGFAGRGDADLYTQAADLIESLAPPLGDVDELCGKDARELLAAEIRADWIASYPAEAVPSETYALKEAANQPAALRAIEKALSDRTALMARVADMSKAIEAALYEAEVCGRYTSLVVNQLLLSSKGSGA